MTLGSSKRSAGAAGMEVGDETSGGKRRRVQEDSIEAAIQTLEVQNEVYAREKFSDSLCISHVLNLFVESEDQHAHTQPHRLTQISR